MNEGLVSTIIPVFNRAGPLREAVASVLAQTYRPIEIIIVNDGSTDETARTIAELAAAHPEIHNTRQTNSGPGRARETGRHQAHGEFLQWLDSDDLLLPRKFELQVRALREHPECGIAYCFSRYRDSAGNEIPCTWKTPNQLQERLFPSFLVGRWWDTPSPLYRASVCDTAGPWTNLRLEEDWEYDCRIAATGVKLCAVPEILSEVRHLDGHRLSGGAALDPARLGDRAEAHTLILGHALKAGIPSMAPEMQHYARELFLLARQCGAAGLVRESRALVQLAHDTTGPASNHWQFPVYKSLATIFGWRMLGRASILMDRFR
jgi:hypothetical protein